MSSQPTEEKIGLFITRAQPGLHRGHLDGIQQALDQGITKLIIGIGSSNKEFTAENPFTYEERKQMIEHSVKNLPNIGHIEVVPIPDISGDKCWREYILNELPPFNYVISGNIRVQELFKDTEKKIIPLTMREMVKGSTLREWLACNHIEGVKQVLSPETVSFLESIHASERVKEIFQQERKAPGITVDIVLFDKKGKLILIERKNYPHGIALPSGFVNVGEQVVNAAKREPKEKLGLEIDDLEYLGYRDAPDRDPRAHNIAHAFYARTVKGEPKAGNDAKAVVRVAPAELDTITFAFPDHKEMILKALLFFHSPLKIKRKSL